MPDYLRASLSTMTIDPLVSLLIGAVGAALIGLFGAWIQSRREHSRWVRERRYDAYLSFLVLNDKHTSESRLNVGPKNDKQIAVAVEPLSIAISTISLLGPERALDAARVLRDAAVKEISTGKNQPEYPKARVAYVVSVRKVLGISADR
jgi:hypothetical protein